MSRYRRIGALACLLLTVSLDAGCAAKVAADKKTELPTPKRELDLPLQGYTKDFANGLRLFVLPDPYTRLVQFDVRQHVGTRDNPAGKAALAHFVEHLMFQIPVEGEGSPKLMQDLSRHTLSFNAYTSLDETHYMHTGTADEIERYMQYTAKRLTYDCAAVPEAAFLRERDVVRNEHRWRGERADLQVRDGVLDLLFPTGHPYRDVRTGEDLEIASITQDDACAFIKKYYTASQAHVVVSGGVDPAKVLELANKYLEPLPAIPKAARAAVPPLNIAGQRHEFVAPVEKPTAVIVYPMPKRFTQDYAASQAALNTLFLAIGFFTGGPSSPIKDWYPVSFGGKEANVFGVAVESKRKGQLDGAVNEVLAAITKGFSPSLKGKEYRAAYDPARQRARLSVVRGLSNVSSRSNALADYLDEGAQAGFFGTELRALDDLTSQRAQQVGGSIFDRDRAMIVKILPDANKEKDKVERAAFDFKPGDDENLAVPDDIDPAEAHRPLPLQDMVTPEGQSVEYELDNGMRVVLVQSTQVPVMEVQLIVGAGEADAEQGDVAMLAARAYGTRVGNREAGQIMRLFDVAGGIFGTGVGPLSTTFSSRGLSIYLDFIIAGVSERVIQSEYRTGALDGWKLGRAEELKKQNRLQAAERANKFNTALYGQGHPHVRAEVTSKRGLRDISLRDIEGFRETHYRAANSTLIMTGGFDIPLAIQYVEKFFGKPKLRSRQSTWQQPRAGAGHKVAPRPYPGSVRVMTEVDPERVQTQVTIGYPLAEVYGDNHAALQVLSEMLNFEVSAVRHELGVSYGVYAGLDTGRPMIRVGGAIDSSHAGEGVAAIKAAIQSIRSGEDFDRKFAFARRQVLKNLINAQGDPTLLANQIAVAVRNGRSYEYFQELAQRVATLTPADIRARMAEDLQDPRSVMLIQGPAGGVQSVLEHNQITRSLALPEVVHDEDE